MIFKNTTKHSDAFLKRLTSWVRKEVGLEKRHLKGVAFLNWRHWRGTAYWSGRIICRVATASRPFPFTWHGIEHVSEVGTIVLIVAHEMQHVLQYRDGSDSELRAARDLEAHCNRVGKRVMMKFEADREVLLTDWSHTETTEATPSVSPVERRAAKATLDLARWEKKLKLAKTKVAKYRRKVQYYTRRPT